MTAIHPLWSLRVGDTFPISGTCADDNSNIIDLTGAQLVEWKLETWPPVAACGAADCDADDSGPPSAPTVVLDLTVGNGIAITNAPLGQLVITITAAQSEQLAPGRYRDQLRVTTAAGVVSTQWVGFIDVKPTF